MLMDIVQWFLNPKTSKLRHPGVTVSVRQLIPSSDSQKYPVQVCWKIWQQAIGVFLLFFFHEILEKSRIMLDAGVGCCVGDQSKQKVGANRWVIGCRVCMDV